VCLRMNVRREPFPVSETHKIALWPSNRLIAHSDGLGWHNLYGSLAAETPWNAELTPLRHHLITYCYAGSSLVHRSVDNGLRTAVTLAPRQFIITPAGIPWQFRIEGQPKILLVYIHQEVTNRVAREALGIDPGSVELIPRLGATDGLLEHLILAVLDSMGRRDRNSVLYVDNLAPAIALQLLCKYSTRGSGQDLSVSKLGKQLPVASLHRARAFLEAGLGEDLTLDDLAEVAEMSMHHFFRAFTLYFGTPPHKFLLQRRIERAKELLSNTSQPLADIAIETGFSSQSHFSSAFKNAVGVPPNTYRLNS